MNPDVSSVSQGAKQVSAQVSTIPTPTNQSQPSVEMVSGVVSSLLIPAIVGAVISKLFDYFLTKRKFKRELQDNNNIDITGEWFAAWQTSVENTDNLNTERLSIVQRGQTVKMKNLEKAPENPKGGYFWEGQLQFFHGRSLMGWYMPVTTENLTSKGIVFLSYQSTKKIFYGKWVGTSYDGELSNGFVVISKERDRSMALLRDLVSKHPEKVNIIYSSL
jgi:hypothetical protein